MIISCNTLLLDDGAQAIPTDIVKIIKPIPVVDKVIEVDVAPIKPIVSTDLNMVFAVFFKISFLIHNFCLWIK